MSISSQTELNTLNTLNTLDTPLEKTQFPISISSQTELNTLNTLNTLDHPSLKNQSSDFNPFSNQVEHPEHLEHP